MLSRNEPKLAGVTLRPVTDENLEEVLALELEESQLGFLPDIASSIAGARGYPDARALAIGSGEETVGFALYGIDQQSGDWKIFRFLIDKNYQGRGLGKLALTAIVNELRAERGAADILVCYQDNNLVARNMYMKFGFREYGKEGTKVSARLPCRPG